MPLSNTNVAVSNVNVEINQGSTTQINYNNEILRALPGKAGLVVPATQIADSDLFGAVGFGGLVSTNTASAADWGQITSTIALNVPTTMYHPNTVWSATVTGQGQGTVVLTPSGQNASLTYTSNTIGTQVANVNVTATMWYNYANGFAVSLGTQTKGHVLTNTVSDPQLAFSGAVLVNNQGYSAQTATTSITATTVIPSGATISFVTVPVGGTVSGNTITLTAVSSTINTDIDLPYVLTTSINYNGRVIFANTQNVDVHAFYRPPALNFDATSYTNNSFANTGSANAVSVTTITYVSTPPSSYNIVWNTTWVSGAQTVIFTSNSTVGTMSLASNSTTGALKSVYNVMATVQYANGLFIASNTAPVTLRASIYGLNFTKAPDVTVAGYLAQTASTTASATWTANTADGSWYYANTSGRTSVSNSVGSGTSSLTVSAAALTVGSSNTAKEQVNMVLNFPGEPAIIMSNVSSSSNLLATFTNYTFTLTPSITTNNSFANASPITASANMVVVHTVAGGNIVWSSTNVSDSNVVLNTAADLQSTNAYITIASGTGAKKAVATVTATLQLANGSVIAAQTTPNITLRTSAYGLNFVSVSTLVNGYVAQSAIATTTAAWANNAADFAWNAANTAGIPTTSNTINSTTGQASFTCSVGSSTVGVANVGIERINAVLTYPGEPAILVVNATSSSTVNASFTNYTFTTTVPATNNQFANSGAVQASANYAAVFTGGVEAVSNVTWSVVTATGDIVTLAVASDNKSANAYFSASTGTKAKNVYTLRGTLTLISNGFVMNTYDNTTTLRASSYGLNFSGSNTVAVQGWLAQTAVSTATAAWVSAAGDFTWDVGTKTGNPTLANTIGAGSATWTTTITSASNTLNNSNNGAQIIYAVMKFPGENIVMANVAGTITANSVCNTFTFTLSGATTNDQIASTATVNSSLITTVANTGITNGSLSYSHTASSNVTLTQFSNSTVYTVNTSVLANTTIPMFNEADTISVNLLDNVGRTIQTTTRALTIRAYTVTPTISTSNTSVSGYRNQSTTSSYTASVNNLGYSGWTVTSALVAGGAMTLAGGSNTTTSKSQTISAVENVLGTNSSTYQVTSNVQFFSVSTTVSTNVTTSAQKLDPSFTLTPLGVSAAAFNFPVYANNKVTVAFNTGAVPSWIVWSGATSAQTGMITGTETYSGNATGAHYDFPFYNSTIGTGYANSYVSADLWVTEGGANVSIASITSTNAASNAQVYNPALLVTGVTSNNPAAAVYDLTTTIQQNVSSNASMTGQTYNFTVSTYSGPAVTFSNTANTITISTSSHAGTNTVSVANLTIDCVKASQIIQTTKVQLTLYANTTIPSVTFTSANASVGAFGVDTNFPLNANAVVDCYVSDGIGNTANIQFTLSNTSGPVATAVTYTNTHLSSTSLGHVLVNNKRTSGVPGTLSTTYLVTVNVYTPQGYLFYTNSANVVSTCQTYDPSFTWGSNISDGSYSTTTVGFPAGASAAVTYQGGANSALLSGGSLISGYTYSIANLANFSSFTSSSANGFATGTLTEPGSTAAGTYTTNLLGASGSLVYAANSTYNITIGASQTRTSGAKVIINPKPVQLYDKGLTDDESGLDSSADVKLTLYANGYLTYSAAGLVVANNWLTPGAGGVASNYAVYVTPTGSALKTGSSATLAWNDFSALAAGGSYFWELTASATTTISKSTTLLVQIATSIDHTTILASSNVSLSVTGGGLIP
jgi:hypothetical protein